MSLHCFINIEDRPSISTKPSYSPTSVNKKEVTCYDKRGKIKLTLWGSCIDYVNKSSVYFVQQAKVREWPKGILSITVTPWTSIKPSKERIVKWKSSLKELLSYCVQFPPISVKIASSIKCCPQCGKPSANEHCKEMTLADETETRYTLKLTFKNRFQQVVIMYSPQLIQYFQMNEKIYSPRPKRTSSGNIVR